MTSPQQAFTAMLITSILCLITITVAQESQSAQTFTAVRVYDPNRNAEQDLRDAVAEAKRTGKHVLVQVGGYWCIWCHIMDKFFEKHVDLAALRDERYVTVAVNFGPENQNKTLLSRYPKIPGYPHLFVLDANGELLRSQKTRDLEDGGSYSTRDFKKFLLKWSPKP